MCTREQLELLVDHINNNVLAIEDKTSEFNLTMFSCCLCSVDGGLRRGQGGAFVLNGSSIRSTISVQWLLL